MKTIILTIVFLFYATSTFAADPWSNKDKALAATMSTLLVVDWGQTINSARNPAAYQEINPILGLHPSEQSIHTYMGTALIGALTISHFLPSKYRALFMGSVIALELPYVYNNYQIGLRMQF